MLHNRSKAFILPLAMSVLILVAGLAVIGFSKIGHAIDSKNLLLLREDVINDRLSIIRVTEELDDLTALKIDMIQNTIDGLYNLSMITVSNFDKAPEVNFEQLAFLERKSKTCGLPQEFPSLAMQFFKDYGVPENPFTLIDFLALANIPQMWWKNVFSCFRVAPKNQLLDISIAKPETLALYFDISQDNAFELRRQINAGVINTKAGVENYLMHINSEKRYDGLVLLTKMDSRNDQRQIFFMSDGENFAYQEKIRGRAEIWNGSRIIFGWTPEVLN